MQIKVATFFSFTHFYSTVSKCANETKRLIDDCYKVALIHIDNGSHVFSFTLLKSMCSNGANVIKGLGNCYMVALIHIGKSGLIFSFIFFYSIFSKGANEIERLIGDLQGYVNTY